MSQPHPRPVALITGASSGIGESLARELAAKGYDLVLCARRVDRLEALAKELPGANVLPVRCDVSKDGEIEGAVNEAERRFGRIDAVFANAGISRVARVDATDIAHFREVFDTNVLGVVRTAQATLPALKKSRGSLAIVGSVMGYVTSAGTSAYSMSKAALKPLAESLRYELEKHGVSVTLILPGFIATEIRKVDPNRPDLRPDPAPAWLQMPARQAARQIADATLARRREAAITFHAKATIWLERHFPFVLRWVIRLQAKRIDQLIGALE